MSKSTTIHPRTLNLANRLRLDVTDVDGAPGIVRVQSRDDALLWATPTREGLADFLEGYVMGLSYRSGTGATVTIPVPEIDDSTSS